MKQVAVEKVFLAVAVISLSLSVVIAVVSLYPVTKEETETSVIIDDSFRLSPLEMRRHGIGSFKEGVNISISVHKTTAWPINFSVQTYIQTVYYSVSTSDINCRFTAGTDYYEAVFYTDANTTNQVHFIVSVQKPKVILPFSYLTAFAKTLFVFSLGSVILLLLKSALHRPTVIEGNRSKERLLSQRSRRLLLILILLSLVFWLFLLAVNNNPFATFENWYTDHARHPYSSNLYTKVGISIFDTPLGRLANGDSSYYKLVTWPHMPHVYSFGSILLFLPFGFLLESGVDQVFVFKMEIALFLLFSHIGLHYFLQRFWKLKIFPILKLVGIYALYVPLIVYSANGMFDAIPFLLSMIALTMYLNDRYDFFLLFMALSVTFKYQPAIFLSPLIVMGALKLIKKNDLSSIITNKTVIAAAALAAISAFTAVLSLPFMMESRPELVLNGINAFSPHTQIPWGTQSFAVLLTLTTNLLFAGYMLKTNSLLSLSAIFLLLPSFSMSYFQIWYLPFFFVYAFLPTKRIESEVTLLWLIFMMIMLSFGGVSFNPLHVLDGWKRVLGF